MLPPTAPLLPLVGPSTVRAVYDNPPHVVASPLRRWVLTAFTRSRRNDEAVDCPRCGFAARPERTYYGTP